MEELFISYELALIAKNKGFNEKCFAFWSGNPHNNEPYRLNITENNWHFHKNNVTAICAPLYQQIVDWLREKHNLHICITPPDGVWKYIYELKYFGFKDQNGGTGYNTHYDALNKAISEAFKLI